MSHDAFRLVVERGPDVGRMHRSAGELVTIGRRASLALSDRAVSREHCAIAVGERGVVVRDLESENGTILDGVTIVEACARHGSVLSIGDTAIRIEISGAATAPAPPRPPGAEDRPPIDASRPWRTQRDGWMRYGERAYVESALRATSRNIAEAARRAGMNRASFYRLMWRAGLR